MADSSQPVESATQSSRMNESFYVETKPFASTSQPTVELSTEDRRFLIECVRQHPCIYDKEHPDYRVLEVKDAAWKKISKLTKLPVQDAVARYHTTRTNFGRYIRTMEATHGCSRDEVYVKPHYEHLKWLLKYMEVRPSTRGVRYKKRGFRYSRDINGEIIPSQPQTIDISDTMWDENGGEEPFEIETEGSENLSYSEEQEGSWTQESNSASKRKLGGSSHLPQETPDQQEVPSPPKVKKVKTTDLESQLLQSIQDDSFPADMPGDASSACTWMAIKLRLKKLTPYQQNMAQARFLQVLTDIEYGPKYPPQYSNQTEAAATRYHNNQHMRTLPADN